MEQLLRQYLENPSRLGYDFAVGSITIECVTFCVYVNDHAPRHVHGQLGKTTVIVDLLPDGQIDLAKRKAAIRPANAKKSDVRKILTIAADHCDELSALWEKIHGKA